MKNLSKEEKEFSKFLDIKHEELDIFLKNDEEEAMKEQESLIKHSIEIEKKYANMSCDELCEASKQLRIRINKALNMSTDGSFELQYKR
jgi:hypothetical protein